MSMGQVPHMLEPSRMQQSGTLQWTKPTSILNSATLTIKTKLIKN